MGRSSCLRSAEAGAESKGRAGGGPRTANASHLLTPPKQEADPHSGGAGPPPEADAGSMESSD